MESYGKIIRVFPSFLLIVIRIQRGLQQSALKLTQSNKESHWKENAVFCIFDCPDTSGPFENRMEFLNKLKKEQEWPSFLHVVEMIKCRDQSHFKEFFETVISKNGEGVMLRASFSNYEPGRSTSMKRYKEYKDTEVKVIKCMLPHGFQCEQ